MIWLSSFTAKYDQSGREPNPEVWVAHDSGAVGVEPQWSMKAAFFTARASSLRARSHGTMRKPEVARVAGVGWLDLAGVGWLRSARKSAK